MQHLLDRGPWRKIPPAFIAMGNPWKVIVIQSSHHARLPAGAYELARFAGTLSPHEVGGLLSDFRASNGPPSISLFVLSDPEILLDLVHRYSWILARKAMHLWRNLESKCSRQNSTSILGGRERLAHSRLGGDRRNHSRSCPRNPKGRETSQRKRDRVIENIEKIPALEGETRSNKMGGRQDRKSCRL